MTGRLSVHTEDWGLVLRNGAAADNSQPQSGVGSAYVNDMYSRATGKWMSQASSLSARAGVTNSAVYLGRFLFCALGYVGDSQVSSSWFGVYPVDGPDALGMRGWVLYASGGAGGNSAEASCI